MPWMYSPAGQYVHAVNSQGHNTAQTLLLLLLLLLAALPRDLKSGNLLVDAAGCVKVADFGLSRLQPGLDTLTGGLCGKRRGGGGGGGGVRKGE
jgi:serine/threonine protein kinase